MPRNFVFFFVIIKSLMLEFFYLYETSITFLRISIYLGACEVYKMKCDKVLIL